MPMRYIDKQHGRKPWEASSTGNTVGIAEYQRRTWKEIA